MEEFKMLRKKRESFSAMGVLMEQFGELKDKLSKYDKFYIHDTKDEGVLWPAAFEILNDITNERVYGLIKSEGEILKTISAPELMGIKVEPLEINEKSKRPVEIYPEVIDKMKEAEVIIAAPKTWEEYEHILIVAERNDKKFVIIAEEEYLYPEQYDDYNVIDKQRYDYEHYDYKWVINL